VEPLTIPVNGVLDLHTFRPQEAADVVADYLEECRKKGILQVRIIHGKGTGSMRRTVEAAISRIESVQDWKPAGHDAGHWGATLVWLKPV
jgi:DNA-nicking Smr family endonuclease